MRTIDVHDLPDQTAKAIAETVQNLRDQLNRPQEEPPNGLPAWHLGAIGPLTRDEIYDHLDAAPDAKCD